MGICGTVSALYNGAMGSGAASCIAGVGVRREQFVQPEMVRECSRSHLTVSQGSASIDAEDSGR